MTQPAAGPRAYGFDLDGTLVDTAPDLHAALNHALSAHRLPPVDVSLARYWIGHGARAMVLAALRHHGEPADDQASAATVDALHAAFLTYYAANVAVLSQPYPSVTATLERLREAGLPLAVVTNKRLEFAESLLKALALRDCFDVVIGGDSTATPKPDGAPLLLACRRLQISAADFLYVGDSTTDVGAARNAGCPVICVSYGYNQGQAPEALGADGIIDHFAELLPSDH